MPDKPPMAPEHHHVDRAGWLRAAVLGANDGLLSTTSLVLGVAAAGGGQRPVLIAAIAGLVSGGMAMAAGEYVSVSAQSDSESADLARERSELRADPVGERHELAQIYVARGLDPALADLVAHDLMQRDALGAHAHDELGITPTNQARPFQAAATSAICFALGAAWPVVIVIAAPDRWLIVAQTSGALVMLAVLGAIGAAAGGAPLWRAALRVTVWGACAFAITTGIGRLIGITVQ